MSVINKKEEENKPTTEGLAALNKAISKDLAKLNTTIFNGLVPQIIDKGDLTKLFTDIIAPMSGALEKSEEVINKARPPRTNQNSE